MLLQERINYSIVISHDRQTEFSGAFNFQAFRMRPGIDRTFDFEVSRGQHAVQIVVAAQDSSRLNLA
ncbi:MAG: hypothetical protein ACI93T_004030 [Porticoccaceae bacterium]|jgi:hypothetical protein